MTDTGSKYTFQFSAGGMQLKMRLKGKIVLIPLEKQAQNAKKDLESNSKSLILIGSGDRI